MIELLKILGSVAFMAIGLWVLRERRGMMILVLQVGVGVLLYAIGIWGLNVGELRTRGLGILQEVRRTYGK